MCNDQFETEHFDWLYCNSVKNMEIVSLIKIDILKLNNFIDMFEVLTCMRIIK